MKNLLLIFLIFLSNFFSFSQSKEAFKKPELSFESCNNELDNMACFNDVIAKKLTEAVKVEIKDYLDTNKKRTYVVNYATFIVGENGKAIKKSIKTTNTKNSEVGSKLKRAVLDLPEIEVRKNEYNYPVLTLYRIRIKNGVNENNEVVILDKTNKTSKQSKKSGRMAPIYPGCESLDNDSLTKCLSANIAKVINRKFKTKKALKGFNKKGTFYIYVFFSVDENGNLSNQRAFGPNEAFEEQALLSLKKIKKITPGTKNGKPVKVPFTLPIKFRVQ